jgi:hypothetical protein
MTWPQLRVRLTVSTFDTGYDGGSSGSDSEGPGETLGEKALFTLRTPPGPAPPQPSLPVLPGPSLPDFWLIVRILQDRVEVYAHARYVEAGPVPRAVSFVCSPG